MKSKLLLLFFCTVFTSTTLALSPDTDNKSATNQGAVASQSKNGEILATLIATNQNEIAVAKLAATKNVQPAVKTYIEKLISDHQNNLTQTEDLSKKLSIQPNETKSVKEMEANGKKTLAKLNSLNGKAFEVAFITDMIKGHKGALKNIDKALQATDNADIKTQLENTRPVVAGHLKMAEDLKSQLSS